ncbi:MAG: hypothetical protein ACYS8I_08780 [Planctomycetota bacterium]
MTIASQVYGDIVVSVESSPTQQSFHGYAEYRISVANNSAKRAHKVTLFLPHNSYGHGEHIRRISRSVVVSPASAATVSIYQPPLPINGEGLGVAIDGKAQRKYVRLATSSHCGNIPLVYGGASGPRSLCMFLSRSVGSDDFENGMDKAFPGSTASHGRRRPWYFIKSESPAGSWSSNWLTYSRYDGVVVTAANMDSMPVTVRAALSQYIQCGGSLLVLGRWRLPEDWRGDRVVHGPLSLYYRGFGVCAVNETPDATTWQVDIWKRLKSDVWDPSAAAAQKTTSVSEANRLFPIVEKLTVPVRGLFVLVLIFAIIIGPVNLYVLSKRKKKIWMLCTVPLISVIACFAVFFYALVAEGWQGYIRTESITFLDEGAHRASTIALNAFYCPLTPRGGLHFDYETEVAPMGIEEEWQGGRARTIDWTRDQHLRTGWVAARIPAHFLLRKSQMRRERLKFTRTINPANMVVLNGLGADIRRLWFADESGRIHTAENITAGTRGALKSTGRSLDSEIKADIWRRAYRSGWLRSLQQITRDPKPYLRPNCYIALLDESLFVEQAIKNLKSQRFQSIVFGKLEGPPDAG